jgi:hypothetical protein
MSLRPARVCQHAYPICGRKTLLRILLLPATASLYCPAKVVSPHIGYLQVREPAPHEHHPLLSACPISGWADREGEGRSSHQRWGTSQIRLSFANWPTRCDQSTVEPRAANPFGAVKSIGEPY